MVSGRLARFDGEIAGFGTATGHRVVVGRWTGSPFGPFADVMHEAPDGTRTLLAPGDEIAGYVAATYRFDRVVVVPVAAERSPDRLRLGRRRLAPGALRVRLRTPAPEPGRRHHDRRGGGPAVSARRDGRTPAAAGRCPPWP